MRQPHDQRHRCSRGCVPAGMTWSRRDFLTLSGALGAVTLIGGGAGCAAKDGPMAVPVAFTGLTVTESGGVDGRRNVLSVETDGTALLMARQVAAGQLPSADLARLQTLLESPQFRREAAAPKAESRYSCSDMVYLTVTMGAVSVGRSGTCGGDEEEPAPAYGEIVALLSPPLRGAFVEPVSKAEPRLRLVELERAETENAAGYRIEVGADGSGSVRRTGRPRVEKRLDRPALDALRLLQHRLSMASADPCTPRGVYQLRIGGTQICGSTSSLEFRSVVVLLEDVFDL